MKNLKQTLINTILPIISAVLVAGLAYAAWVEPGTAPPGNNVPAPVNVGATAQYKSGAFGVGGLLRGYSNAIFDGNVGIGTVNPAKKLDVVGDVNATGDVKGTRLCIGSDCRTAWPSASAPAPAPAPAPVPPPPCQCGDLYVGVGVLPGPTPCGYSFPAFCDGVCTCSGSYLCTYPGTWVMTSPPPSCNF